MRSVLACVALLIGAVGYCQGAAKLDQKELAMLKGLEKTYSAAKAKSLKAPKDAKLKKDYVGATLKYADAVLVSPALSPKEKYPRSLKLYREARKVDPKNAHAKENIDLIEGIYKQMGRPIPPN